MRSPAVPPSSLALRLALYSAGGDGEKVTWMSGCFTLKAGMILSFQIVASSLRQLSMVSEPAKAAPVMALSAVAAKSSFFKPDFIMVFSFLFSLCRSTSGATLLGANPDRQKPSILAGYALRPGQMFER